jgi:hypothetical protein
MDPLPQENQSECRWRLLAGAAIVCLVLASCEDSPAIEQPATPTRPASIQTPKRTVPPAREERGKEPSLPDLRGVEFVDVAAERGLVHKWPEQPRPLRVMEAFGCGCATFDGDGDGWQDVLLVDEPFPVLYRNLDGRRFEDVTESSGFHSVEGKWKGCAIGDVDGDGLLDVFLTGYHRLALYKNLGGLRFQAVTQEAGFDPENRGNWSSSAGFMDLDSDGWLDLVLVNFIEFGPGSREFCTHKGVIAGCPPREYPPIKSDVFRNTGQGRFELVPPEQGMDQSHGVGLVLAFIDLNDDGLVDFYIGNDGLPADFMLNHGGMRFQNIADTAGVANDGQSVAISSMGADWADFNLDGRLDLIVTNFQFQSFVVFQNVGDNMFMDASLSTGLTNATRNRLGFGSKWVDFENDGWPDMYFVNGHVYDNAHLVDGAGAEFRQPVQLLRNERGRRFVDLVPALGPEVGRSMVGRGSATADFDNDGRVDLLAVDYEGPVMLLENRTRSGGHWLKLDLRSAAPNVFAYGARVVGKCASRIWLADVAPATSYLSSSDPRIHWGLGEVDALDVLEIRWPSGRRQTLRDVAADQILRIEEPREAVP